MLCAHCHRQTADLIRCHSLNAMICEDCIILLATNFCLDRGTIEPTILALTPLVTPEPDNDA